MPLFNSFHVRIKVSGGLEFVRPLGRIKSNLMLMQMWRVPWFRKGNVA